jgi:hypothetical protein
MVVNMNIVARIKFSCNIKKSSSAVGYYSYTNRCVAYKMTPKFKQTNIEQRNESFN